MNKEAKSFFRYPGGKSRLAKQIFNIIEGKVDLNTVNSYIEPFIGGGSMFLYMVQRLEKLQYCVINDKDNGIYAIWETLLSNPDGFIGKIKDYKPTVDSYIDFSLRLNETGILDDYPIEEVAFEKIALHQMSHSGLGLKSGSPIGGFEQKGKYKIDCRYNPDTMARKINDIVNLLRKISQIALSNADCLEILDDKDTDKKNKLIYIDPPYYQIGNTLYQEGMTENEHIELSKKLNSFENANWFISYDDCPFIRDLYSDCDIETINANYTINNKGKKNEILICPKKS